MKNIITVILICFVALSLNGQVQHKGNHKIVDGKLNFIDKKTVDTRIVKQKPVYGILNGKRIPTVNITSESKVAKKNIKIGSPNPLQENIYAVNIQGVYSPQNSGIWGDVEGGKIWQLGIHAEDANGINFLLKDFYLDKGVELYVYAADYSDTIGALTYENNPANGILPIRIISYNTIVFELYVPSGAKEPLFSISDIASGIKQESLNSYGEADPSTVDINCPVGSNWKVEKQSVVVITYLESGTWWKSTGYLVNNVRGDGTPFIATAYHCVYTEAIANTLIAYFNYENQYCGSVEGPKTQTVSGASYLAGDDYIDFSLLRLNSAVPISYKPVYAGWNVSGNVILHHATGISHPCGDVKKIQIEESNFSRYENWNDTIQDKWWHIGIWEHGRTEGGSSGSPLFDREHRAIGGLFGSSTGGTYPIYHNWEVAWNRYSPANKQLKHWLDPDNTGVRITDAYSPSSAMIPSFYTKGYRYYVGDTVTFYNHSQGNYNYCNWDFTASATQQYVTTMADSVKVIFTSDGLKDIRIAIDNPTDNMVFITDSAYINLIYKKPVANFSANITSAAQNQNITFTAQVSYYPTSYSWNFGPGAIPATSGIGPHIVKYSTGGAKTVTFTASNPGGATTVTKTNYINVIWNAPIANFTINKTIADQGEIITLTNTSQNYYNDSIWSYGACGSFTGSKRLQYSCQGWKTISLTVSNPNGTNTKTVNNAVYIKYKKPVVAMNITTSGAYAVNNPVSMNATGSTGEIQSFAWDFGSDATPSTATGIGPHSVTYSTHGQKQVRLTLSNVDYTVDSVRVITINPLEPIASFSVSEDTIYQGESVTFTSTSSGVIDTCSWSFGLGATPATATGVGPHQVYYSNSGIIKVTLSVRNISGNNNANQYIIIKKPAPNANFTISKTIVNVGDTVIITDNSFVRNTNEANYQWNFGYGATPATATGVGPHYVSYMVWGSKKIDLTITDSFGTSNMSKDINVITSGIQASFTSSKYYVTTSDTLWLYSSITGPYDSLIWNIEGSYTPNIIKNKDTIFALWDQLGKYNIYLTAYNRLEPANTMMEIPVVTLSTAYFELSDTLVKPGEEIQVYTLIDNAPYHEYSFGAPNNYDITSTQGTDYTILYYKDAVETITLKAWSLDDWQGQYYSRKVYIENSSPVKQVNEKEIKVYPNPAQEYLYIEGMAIGEPVQIVSLDGRVVYEGTVKNTPHKIQVQGLSSGVYLIQCKELNWKVVVR